MRYRTVLSIAAMGAAIASAACNSGALSPNSVCGGKIFLVIANGKSSTLTVGQDVTLIAQQGVLGPGVGSTGCVIQNIPAASVTWGTTDSTIVSIATDGTAHALAPGKADVSAAKGGLSATLSVTVVQ